MAKTRPTPAGDRKHLTLALGALALLAVGWFVFASFFKVPEQSVSGGAIVDAIQRYCTEQKPAARKVTFSELIARGYLPPDTLQKFGASEITVSLDANSALPQEFLMDARMADGSHQTLLSDGSVQQFSESRVREAIRAQTTN